jgi:anti-sigma factor RsiW
MPDDWSEVARAVASYGGWMTVLPLKRREIVCQQAVELVTDYLEGALSRRDRRRFEAHLKVCPNCAAYLEQIKMTIRLTGEIEPEDLTPEARQDLTELYRRWRSEQ